MSAPLYSPDDDDAIAMESIEPDMAAALLGERVRALPSDVQVRFGVAFRDAISSGNVEQLARVLVDAAPSLGLVVMLRAPSRLLTVNG